jgi:hypothetical protein
MPDNRTIIAGRLTTDPEVVYDRDNLALVYLHVKTGKKNIVKCKVVGDLAQIAGRHLNKGRMVALEGAYGSMLGVVDVTDMQMLDDKVPQAKYVRVNKRTGKSKVVSLTQAKKALIKHFPNESDYQNSVEELQTGLNVLTPFVIYKRDVN